MKHYIIFTTVVTLSLAACTKKAPEGYPITPVPFTSVKVTDDFWGQRLEASREVTIPLAFSMEIGYVFMGTHLATYELPSPITRTVRVNVQ